VERKREAEEGVEPGLGDRRSVRSAGDGTRRGRPYRSDLRLALGGDRSEERNEEIKGLYGIEGTLGALHTKGSKRGKLTGISNGLPYTGEEFQKREPFEW